MDDHPSNKFSRRRWADLDDSFSSTEAGFDTEPHSAEEVQHPEVQVLFQVLKNKSLPITIYLNNLPYSLAELSEVLSFVGVQDTQDITASFILKDGKPCGRAQITTHSRNIAKSIVSLHAKAFQNRPVYMNLDGFFGRGKTYKNQFKPRKQNCWKPRFNRPNKQMNTYSAGKINNFCSSVTWRNLANSSTETQSRTCNVLPKKLSTTTGQSKMIYNNR